MALITCYECKENISEDTRVCPKCGAKQFRFVGFKDLINQIFWSIVLIFIVPSQLKQFFDIDTSMSCIVLVIISVSLVLYGYNKRV